MRLALLWMAFALPAAHAEGVRVEGAWARAAVPGGTGAFYCTLIGGDADDALETVSSPAAGMAMLHRTTGGTVKTMEPVNGLNVPAGETVRLAPGGYHAMLMDARPGLDPGRTIEVTLHFSRAGDVVVTVPVVRAGSGAPAH